MKLTLKANFKKHPVSYFIVAATVAIMVSLLAAPAFSLSSNQCSSCHGSAYNMQLDIVEGSQNTIPTTIQVGQTQTVTVAIANINNAPNYNTFSSVTVTLTSQNGHFSVAQPTYSIGNLPTGTATATWKITGVSQGSDALLISASAINTHEYLQYSDSYSPSPQITVTPNSDPNYTPPPSPTPTSTPTPTPTPSPPPATNSPQRTANPTVAPTPVPTHTPLNPTSTSTPAPTLNATPSVAPTVQPSPNPTTNQDATHALNSQMLYVHPPLAIAGYVLIFAFAVLVFKQKYLGKITKTVGIGLWVFTLLGLLTGMLWAQSAWGSYWSWDPKETLTLALFLAASAGQLLYFEKKYPATKWVAILTCALVVLTGLSSFIIAGLHSYL